MKHFLISGNETSLVISPSLLLNLYHGREVDIFNPPLYHGEISQFWPFHFSRFSFMKSARCSLNIPRVSNVSYEATDFTHGFNEVLVIWSLVLCVCFVDRCLFFGTFSFDHYVVCPSSIYGFWLLFKLFI